MSTEYPGRDEDGACSRCGLPYLNDRHRCPPGFWSANERAEYEAKSTGYVSGERVRVRDLLPGFNAGGFGLDDEIIIEEVKRSYTQYGWLFVRARGFSKPSFMKLEKL